MIRLHLISNAHLDPVWQWQWNEGAAAAISTFRVAADFCEQFDGYVFNHNEALLYMWTKEYEPQLFQRIQKLVKEGRWHIMGGWFLQPDCNMPSGEDFVRQILVGRRFFLEHFGACPTTAVNFDSFGHTKGLVQILQKSGYDSYLFMRPDPPAEELKDLTQLFCWEGFAGSKVHGMRDVYKRQPTNISLESSAVILSNNTVSSGWSASAAPAIFLSHSRVSNPHPSRS